MSVVLVAGVVSGALARRLHLPSITGQILVGVLIGPSVLAVFDHATIRGLEPFLDFALGLMAVAVGSHLHWARLKNAKRRLAWLLLFEALLTPVLVFTSLAFVPDIQTPFAMLVSAIAISTAPATILAMVKETHSKGVFVKTLLASVALNNLACICLFELAHTAARLQLDPAASPGFLTLVGAPLRQLVYSAALGGGIGAILVFATPSTRASRPCSRACSSASSWPTSRPTGRRSATRSSSTSSRASSPSSSPSRAWSSSSGSSRPRA